MLEKELTSVISLAGHEIVVGQRCRILELFFFRRERIFILQISWRKLGRRSSHLLNVLEGKVVMAGLSGLFFEVKFRNSL